jgi:hypothetical protein
MRDTKRGIVLLRRSTRSQEDGFEAQNRVDSLQASTSLATLFPWWETLVVIGPVLCLARFCGSDVATAIKRHSDLVRRP